MDSLETRQTIDRMIYRSCLYKNEYRWDDWLDMCEEDFEYLITAFSPEVRKDMIYLSGSKSEIESLVSMLPKHNSDRSPLRRHAVVYDVEIDESQGTATATTSVAVYMTHWDGSMSHMTSGSTELYVAGTYQDQFRLNGDGIKFTRREFKLDTRNLQKGCHYPL